MGFLDRLRRLLSGRAVPNSGSPAAVEVQQATKIVNPSTQSMKSVNSIAFSSDLSTLYLIDDGRALAFPLDGRGVQVALVNEQLSVVSTARVINLPEPFPDPTTIEPDKELVRGERASLLKRPDGDEVRLKLDPRDQYTAAFNPDSGVIAIIGSTDIISTLEQPDAPDGPRATCRQFLFDLNREIVLIKKSSSLLSIQTKKRGK